MRIGLVTADATEAARMRRLLRADSRQTLIWIASNEKEAIGRMREDPPDALLLSQNCGTPPASIVKSIMRSTPCPIVLITQSIDANAATIFDALGAGAIDVLPLTDEMDDRAAEAALNSKLRVMRSLSRAQPKQPEAVRKTSNGKFGRLVLLGASAGGPAALANVLAALPENFPAPVIIVQHLDQQFAAELTSWLAQQARLPVRLARDNEVMQPGTIYMPGRDAHLVLRDRYRLAYEQEPRNHPYRPSIDQLFFSVARHWNNGVIGVLLTGMGRDGAEGLRALRDAGALTITQDRESSVVYGIPKAAAKINAAAEILPLDKIGKRIAMAVAAHSEA